MNMSEIMDNEKLIKHLSDDTKFIQGIERVESIMVEDAEEQKIEVAKKTIS